MQEERWRAGHLRKPKMPESLSSTMCQTVQPHWRWVIHYYLINDAQLLIDYAQLTERRSGKSVFLIELWICNPNITGSHLLSCFSIVTLDKLFAQTYVLHPRFRFIDVTYVVSTLNTFQLQYDLSHCAIHLVDSVILYYCVALCYTLLSVECVVHISNCDVFLCVVLSCVTGMLHCVDLRLFEC